MNKLKSVFNYFSKAEIILWLTSITLIVSSFLLFDRKNYLTLIASIIGASALIFSAKGNPIGQVLMIIFSVFYGIISWLKNPYNGNKAEVKINKVQGKEIIFMLLLSAGVTLAFYFILKGLNTANLLPSTISVTTSFIAVYLTFRRSPYFALIYAANDIVLIILWVLAAFSNTSYISVIICFIAFLINDLYSFFNWKRMEKRQLANERLILK